MFPEKLIFMFFTYLGTLSGALGVSLGGSWELFRALGGSLGRTWGSLGLSWGAWGRSMGSHKLFLGLHGLSFGVSGMLLAD